MDPLPRFLLAHDLDAADPEEVFIVHTQPPRFIGRIDARGLLHPTWTDAPPADLNAPAVLEAMRAASAFYQRTVAHAKDLRADIRRDEQN